MYRDTKLLHVQILLNPLQGFVTAFLFFVICLVLYCVVVVVTVKGRGLITETAGTLVTRQVLSAGEQ